MKSSDDEKRLSIKLHCPNPLFVKWLEQWRDEAKEKNSKTQHAYSLALKSLRKYPLPLQNGGDCKILKGFGNKLCTRLNVALKKHQAEQKMGDVNNDVQVQATSPSKIKKTGNKKKQVEQKIPSSGKETGYVPMYKSGPYAILLSLYKASLENNHKGFMHKTDLIRAAQPICDTSFTKAEPGTFYTAWSSMNTLLSKKLVKKVDSPAKFSLTDAGIILGHRLYTTRNSVNEPPLVYSSSTDKENNDTSEQISLNKKYSEASFYHEDETKNLDLNSETIIENLNIPKPVIATSSEISGICGVFSTKEVENEVELKSRKESVKSIAERQDFILKPYSFDIILYVDTQETNRSHTDSQFDPIIAELRHLSVNFEVKNLKVGDYCWICRDKTSEVELVIPYIIERKRMDDLAHSVKDGRFHEQKFRLQQCGLPNVIYMIERYGDRDEHVGLPLPSLYQAALNTLIHNGFCVKFAEGVRGVAEYLSCMSNMIKRNFESKTIMSCPKENITNTSITDEFVSLMYFKEFNILSSKVKNFTVKEMFIRQMLQIKGLSVDKALAIAETYRTPYLLKSAFDEDVTRSVNNISNVKYGKLGKKIGPVLANIIYQFFTKMSF